MGMLFSRLGLFAAWNMRTVMVREERCQPIIDRCSLVGLLQYKLLLIAIIERCEPVVNPC